jgi:hypothetical protein
VIDWLTDLSIKPFVLMSCHSSYVMLLHLYVLYVVLLVTVPACLPGATPCRRGSRDSRGGAQAAFDTKDEK